MNLQGWDTASIVSFDLINKALEDNSQKLVTRFEYKEGSIQLKGTFGPWRVVRGGSLQRLHLQIPVVDGWIRGLRRERKTKIDGTIVTVEIGLRLLPRADASDTRDLVFDLEDGGTPETRPIRGIDVDVQSSSLNDAQIEMVSLALIDCLNAHAEQVAFVFATLEARATATDAWLQMPHVDFANIEVIDGPNYLAIMGSRTKPTADMALDRFDLKLLEGYPPAIFAASKSLYAAGVLAPWMNEHFKPKATFAPASVTHPRNKEKLHGVSLKGAVTLPKRDNYQPILKRLDLALPGPRLLAMAEAQVHIAVGCHLQVAIEMSHKFALDPKTGKFSLTLERAPDEKHWFDANNILGWIVAAGATVAEWLSPAMRDQISHALSSIAKQMSGSSNPLHQPKLWNGLRDFEPGRFLTNNVFWLADTRPATPLTFQMPVRPVMTVDENEAEVEA